MLIIKNIKEIFIAIKAFLQSENLLLIGVAILAIIAIIVIVINILKRPLK